MLRAPLVVALLAGCGRSPTSHDAVLAPVEHVPAPVAHLGDTATPDVALPADAAPPDAAGLAIVDAPLKWTDERERLTLEYRRAHSDPAATGLDVVPRVIVLHYTGGGSAKGTLSYFNNLRVEATRPQLAKAGAVNVSAHFVVDRDGTIYRIQPETRFARHCIGLNHIAIGIENVGDEAKYPLTDAQVTADAALIRDLAGRFPITHLLGHYEAMKFRNHAYYAELDPTYKNAKPDPGDRFMTRVRALVEDLKLQGL